LKKNQNDPPHAGGTGGRGGVATSMRQPKKRDTGTKERQGWSRNWLKREQKKVYPGLQPESRSQASECRRRKKKEDIGGNQRGNIRSVTGTHLGEKKKNVR